MPTVKEMLVRELNVLNVQTLSVTDLQIGAPVVGASPTAASLTLQAAPTGTIPTAGKTRVSYHRVDLSAAFDIIGRNVTVAIGNTFYDILPSLKRYTGLVLSTEDFTNQNINWVDDAATLTVTPNTASKFWVGSVTLNLVLKPVSIGKLYSTHALSFSKDTITPALFHQMANRTNGAYVPFSAVTISNPIDTASNGMSTAHNTAVQISAVAGSGYTGSTYLYYDRQVLSSVFTEDQVLNAPDAVTSGDDVVNVLRNAQPTQWVVGDLLDTEIDYSSLPSYYVVEANPLSWTYTGEQIIEIRRRSDYKQTITVNITADDYAYTEAKLSAAILSLWDGSSAYADVNLNIAKNITLVGADATIPTLVLKNFGGITQTNYAINNLGSIYGRGGKGGVGVMGAGGLFASVNAPGGTGGSAIDVHDANVLLSVTNGGRIAGGGGGGGGFFVGRQVDGSTDNRELPGTGGDGAPFGGSAATLTNPGTTVQLTAYDAKLTCGSGGGVASVGKNSTYTVSGIPPGTSKTTAQTNGGLAGEAFVGNLSNVTYVVKGIVLPIPLSTPIGSDTVVNSHRLQATFLDPSDATKAAGMFSGADAVMTNSSNVATMAGLNNTGSQTTGSFIMNRFYLDGKILMFPLAAWRYTVPWNSLYSAGVVYGDGTVGTPPSGVTPKVQDFKVADATSVWSVRLMRGFNSDPLDTSKSENSEWERLVYYLSTLAAPNNVGYNWASYASETFGMYGPAFYGPISWVIETDPTDNTKRGTRGAGSGLYEKTKASLVSTSTTGAWRPMFELVKTVDLSDYNKFLTWMDDQNIAIDGAGSYFNRKSDTLRFLLTPWTSYSNDYGSCWGGSTSDWSSGAGSAPHAAPSALVASSGGAGARRQVMMVVSATTAKAWTASTRNGVTVQAGTTNSKGGILVTRFVYFDIDKGMMMENNPSTMSASKPFTWQL